MTASTSNADHADHEPRAIWLRDELGEDGTYHVIIELGDDDAQTLDGDAAYRWAREVLTAAIRAEYDAAVIRQATELGLEPLAGAQLVVGLREIRGPLPPTLLGLAMVPGVSAATREPFLLLQRNGQAIGQWTTSDARQHAVALLEAVEAASLDTAYRRLLEETVGLDRSTATAMVEHLGHHPDKDGDPT